MNAAVWYKIFTVVHNRGNDRKCICRHFDQKKGQQKSFSLSSRLTASLASGWQPTPTHCTCERRGTIAATTRCAQQTAVAPTLLGNVWRSPVQPSGDNGPPLSDVLQLADTRRSLAGPPSVPRRPRRDFVWAGAQCKKVGREKNMMMMMMMMIIIKCGWGRG